MLNNLCFAILVILMINFRHRSEKHPNSFSYHCDGCGCGFTLEKNLTDHSNVCKGSGGRGQDSLVCNICGKTVLSKRNLKNHMLTHDPQRELLPCNDCDKRFSTPSALRDHR